MTHVMAGRSLMTLSAIRGANRGVLKCRYSPLCSSMTGRTIRSEKSKVGVFGAMATRTIKFRFEQGNERVARREVSVGCYF